MTDGPATCRREKEQLQQRRATVRDSFGAQKDYAREFAAARKYAEG